MTNTSLELDDTSSILMKDPQNATSDPYEVASLRLQEVLEDVRHSADDRVLDEVGTYPAGAKLTFCTNMGSFLTLGAFIVCWLAGEDPLGGMSLSDTSLEAALVGASCAVPLIICSMVSRTPAAKRTFPVLADLHASQRDLLAPLLSGLSHPQMAILSTFMTLPLLFALLPAMKGTLLALFDGLYTGTLAPLQPWLTLPGDLGDQAAIILPAVFSSMLAGAFIASELTVNRRELRAIRTAMDNSERYFRFSIAATAGATPLQPFEPRRASEAFRIVALVWVLMRKKVAQLAYVLTALNVTYFGMIWQSTGDLTTPAVCALLHNAVEFLYVHRELHGSSRGGDGDGGDGQAC